MRIGDKAGVKSVPNVLGRVGSYDELRKVAGHFGPDLVVQTAFGDSGHTTFFISSEQDWNKYAKEIVSAGDVKIMKRIRCRGSAIEACATRNGTIVGPLMTELVGLQGADPLSRRLVRERNLCDRVHRFDPRPRPRPDLPLRRAAAQGGLPRLLRVGFPGRS